MAGFDIDSEERLEVYTTLAAIANIVDGEQTNPPLSSPVVDPRTGNQVSIRDPLLVLTLVIIPENSGSAPESVTTAVIVGVGGAMGMAGELQALGALAFMGCADPQTRRSFASYRILSPAAVTNSYSGVIIGNAAIIAGIFLIQSVVVLLIMLMCSRRSSPFLDAQARARFPALTIFVANGMHGGTAFAASQIISQPSEYATWEIAIAALGFAYTMLYPVGLCLFPFLRVERAFQEYAVDEWVSNKRWPRFSAVFMPTGAIFSVSTRQACGPCISPFRSPPRQIWWMSMPIWTSLIIGIAGLFDPSTILLCQILYTIMGVAVLLTAVAIAVGRPLRTPASNWITGFSRVVVAALMFCMTAVLSLPADSAATNAVRAMGALLIVVTIVSILTTVCGALLELWLVSDDVPVSLLWTHIPGRSAKVTQQFMAGDGFDVDLISVAQRRDINENGEEAEEELQSKSTPTTQHGAATRSSEEMRVETYSSSTSSLTDHDTPLQSATRAHANTAKPLSNGTNISPPMSSSSSSVEDIRGRRLTSKRSTLHHDLLLAEHDSPPLSSLSRSSSSTVSTGDLDSGAGGEPSHQSGIGSSRPHHQHSKNRHHITHQALPSNVQRQSSLTTTSSRLSDGDDNLIEDDDFDDI